MTTMFIPTRRSEFHLVAQENLSSFLGEWRAFMQAGKSLQPALVKERFDKSAMNLIKSFDERRRGTTNAFEADVKSYFQAKRQ